MTIDKRKFASYIATGLKPMQAYVKAGGSDTEGCKSNASRLSRNEVVRGYVNEELQNKVLNGMVKLPDLTEKAINKLGELMDSDDERISLNASKVVLDKARDFLPRELNVKHSRGDNEQTQAIGKLEDIAKKLLSQANDGGGAAYTIIEGIREEQSRSVDADISEPEGSEEHTGGVIQAEQETETDT